MDFSQIPQMSGPQRQNPGIMQWLQQMMQGGQQPPAQPGGGQGAQPQQGQGMGQGLFGAAQNMLGFNQPPAQGVQQPGMPMNLLPPEQQQSPASSQMGGAMGMGQNLFKSMFGG